MELSSDYMLNALTLRRSLPTRSVPLDQIQIPSRDIPHDPIFYKQYISFLEGKLIATHTRVALKDISEGFFMRKDSGKFEHFCDNTREEDVEYLAQLIKGGHRPPLYLYKNINPTSVSVYVCPDDVASYRAYTNLGIKKIPAIILSSKPRSPNESGFRVKVYRINEELSPAHIHSIYKFHPDLVPAFIGNNLSEDYEIHIKRLIKEIEKTKNKVRSFHTSGEFDLHYHHVLFSTLFRLEETLTAIRILSKEDMWYQAVPLLRTLYEIFLNFYIDWLAPEQIHPFLAISSVTTDAEIEYFIKDYCSKLRQKGGKKSASEIRRCLEKTFYLVRNVKQKAEISPLGPQFYKNIYGFLSRITHQDFETTAHYAHTLEIDDKPSFKKETIISLLRCADIIVTSVVLRIRDDVGDEGIDYNHCNIASHM